MKILLHMCCGPCSIYPIKELRKEGDDIMGFFYRHNIHPYTECMKREETLKSYTDSQDIPLIVQKGYEIEKFLQAVVFREGDRCRYCYHDRLRATAKIAKRGKFDSFTTTLLYSKFQNHERIRSMGEALGKKEGIPFLYKDFREGWSLGIEESKGLKMYRQQYCGCIYSEKVRYYKDRYYKDSC